MSSADPTQYITQSNHKHPWPSGWSNGSPCVTCPQWNEKILKINTNMKTKTHFPVLLCWLANFNPRITANRANCKSKLVNLFDKWVEQVKHEPIIQKRHSLYFDTWYNNAKNVKDREYVINNSLWNQKKSLIEWSTQEETGDKKSVDNLTQLNKIIGNNSLLDYLNELRITIEEGLYPTAKIISVNLIFRHASVKYSELPETSRHWDDYWLAMTGIICDHGTYLVPNIRKSGYTRITELDGYFMSGADCLRHRHSFELLPNVGNIIITFSMINGLFCDKMYDKFLATAIHPFYKLKVRLVINNENKPDRLVEYVDENRDYVEDDKDKFKETVLNENRKKKKKGKYKLSHKKRRKRDIAEQKEPATVHIKRATTNNEKMIIKMVKNKLTKCTDIMTGQPIKNPINESIQWGYYGAYNLD